MKTQALQNNQLALSIKIAFAFVAALILASCMSPRVNPNLNLMSESDYYSVIEKNSQKRQIYDGLSAILQIGATLNTSEVTAAQLDQSARIFQWTVEQYENEKSKVATRSAKETTLFLSFYVPERRHDDLDKSKTLWKIFLDVGGKRYEGKAKKIKTIFADSVALYPYHNRWSTAYELSFPVSTSIASTGGAKLTLTGPVASTSVDF